MAMSDAQIVLSKIPTKTYYDPAVFVEEADRIVGLVISIVNVLELSAQSFEFPALSFTVAFIF